MWIESIRLQNFLAANGVEPAMESGNAAFYWRNKELNNLLDSYAIRCFTSKKPYVY